MVSDGRGVLRCKLCSAKSMIMQLSCARRPRFRANKSTFCSAGKIYIGAQRLLLEATRSRFSRSSDRGGPDAVPSIFVHSLNRQLRSTAENSLNCNTRYHYRQKKKN